MPRLLPYSLSLLVLLLPGCTSHKETAEKSNATVAAPSPTPTPNSEPAPPHPKKNQHDADALLIEARKRAQALGKALKSNLVSAMKEGGPLAAIGVCNTVAPGKAKEISTEGWKVGRTATKLRNPKNTPDDWEKKILASFEEKLAGGAKPSTLEHHEFVVENEKRAFRYMKAIPTGPECLGCHGSTIAPKVAKHLDTLYPEDQARGFEAGSLRGAFTLQLAL